MRYAAVSISSILFTSFSVFPAFAIESSNSQGPALATSTTSSANDRDEDHPFFDFRYEADFSGPTLSHPSGREVGPGPNLNVEHYFRPGYYLGNSWKIKAVAPVLQRIVPEYSRARRWDVEDPRIGLMKGRVLKEEIHGVELKLTGFYFVPASYITKNNIGGEFDAGDGTVELESLLEKSIPRTPFSLGLRWRALEYLKKNPVDNTRTERFELYNRFYTKVSQKIDVFAGYNNYINWYRDYKDNWHDFQTMEVGSAYYFTADNSLEVFFESPFLIKETALWAILQYRFF